MKVGQRVRVKSLNIKGSVSYIDWPNISNQYMFPFQIELDEPYDDTGHTLYRTEGIDLVKLKKKKGTEKNLSPIEKIRKEVKAFNKWLASEF